MKSSLSFFIIITLIIGGFQRSTAQSVVNVQVTMVPPVSPYLNQMLSTVNGRLMVQVTFNSQPGSTLNIKLAGA